MGQRAQPVLLVRMGRRVQQGLPVLRVKQEVQARQVHKELQVLVVQAQQVRQVQLVLKARLEQREQRVRWEAQVRRVQRVLKARQVLPAQRVHKV